MSTWWSRWWYSLCALPAGTVTVEVQDFVDLWARREKDYWDSAIDFVDLSLPFEQMFLVASAPKRFYADLGGLQPWPRSWPRRWGIYFESAQTDAVWSEGAAVLRDGLLPPHFHLKLRPGRLPTIGRPPERELVS